MATDSIARAMAAAALGSSEGVQSVNGMTGDVTIELKNLTQDAGHRLVSDTNKETWNGKQDPLEAGVDYATMEQLDEKQDVIEDLSEIRTAAQNAATIAAQKAQLSDMQDSERRISLLYDLTKGTAWRAEQDTTEAYSKSVPSGAHAVEILMISGKSMLVDGEIAHADVDKVIASKDGVDTAEMQIPTDVRALEGYGQQAVGGEANVVDFSASTYTEYGHYVNGEWVAEETPVVTDISSMLDDVDTLVDAEGGGTIVFHQNNGTEFVIENKTVAYVNIAEALS